MGDIRSLVSDPAFRSLSDERKRVILSKAGAPPNFIDQYLHVAPGAATIGPASEPLPSGRTPAEALDRLMGWHSDTGAPTTAEEPLGDADAGAAIRGLGVTAMAPLMAPGMAVATPAVAVTHAAAALPIGMAISKATGAAGKWLGQKLGLPETGEAAGEQAGMLAPTGLMSKYLRWRGRGPEPPPPPPGLAEPPPVNLPTEVPPITNIESEPPRIDVNEQPPIPVAGAEPTARPASRPAPVSAPTEAPTRSGILQTIIDTVRKIQPEAKRLGFELVGRRIGAATGIPGASFLGGRVGRALHGVVSEAEPEVTPGTEKVMPPAMSPEARALRSRQAREVQPAAPAPAPAPVEAPPPAAPPVEEGPPVDEEAVKAMMKQWGWSREKAIATLNQPKFEKPPAPAPPAPAPAPAPEPPPAVEPPPAPTEAPLAPAPAEVPPPPAKEPGPVFPEPGEPHSAVGYRASGKGTSKEGMEGQGATWYADSSEDAGAYRDSHGPGARVKSKSIDLKKPLYLDLEGGNDGPGMKFVQEHSSPDTFNSDINLAVEEAVIAAKNSGKYDGVVITNHPGAEQLDTSGNEYVKFKEPGLIPTALKRQKLAKVKAEPVVEKLSDEAAHGDTTPELPEHPPEDFQRTGVNPVTKRKVLPIRPGKTPIERQPIESSAFNSAGYNPEKKILEVETSDGRVYRHHGVTPEEWASVADAKSKGKRLTELMRAYPGTRQGTVEPPPPPPGGGPSDDLAAAVAEADAATPEPPKGKAPVTTENASGESAASAEAMSRGKGMKARKEQYVVYDQAGNKRPLIGPEAVDYKAKKGETYGIEGPDGFRALDNQGGKVPSEKLSAEVTAGSDRVRQQKVIEDNLALDAKRKALFTAPNADKAKIVEGLSESDAKSILAHLDAAPGDNPAARAAIREKFPNLATRVLIHGKTYGVGDTVESGPAKGKVISEIFDGQAIFKKSDTAKKPPFGKGYGDK